MSYIGSKPANAVVTSEQIADGVISTNDLANNAVTAAKMAAAGAWAPSGTIIQTVSFGTNDFSYTTSNTPIDTGLTATITPKLATSKILVLVAISTYCYSATASSNSSTTIQLMRNATAIFTDRYSPYFYTSIGSYSNQVINQNGFHLVDTPATTSALTYKVQYNATASGNQSGFNATGDSFGAGGKSTITLMEIAV